MPFYKSLLPHTHTHTPLQTDVEQECSLCPDKSPPGTPSRGEKFVANANCRSLEFFYSVFRKDECSSVQFNFGVDLGAFCGCAGVAANNTCTLCENGAEVKDRAFKYTDDITCGEAFDYAPFIIRDSFCEEWQVEPRKACCPASGAAGFTALASLLVVVGMGVLPLFGILSKGKERG